jgi:hypothetical protein
MILSPLLDCKVDVTAVDGAAAYTAKCEINSSFSDLQLASSGEDKLRFVDVNTKGLASFQTAIHLCLFQAINSVDDKGILAPCLCCGTCFAGGHC